MTNMTGGGRGLRNLDRTGSPRSTTPPWEGSHAVLSLDPVFDALSHPQRRFFLYALHAGPGRTVQELAEQLVEWRVAGPDDAADEGVQQTYLTLYHTHVPKLVECEVVEFDDDTGVVTHGPNADRALAALAGAVQSLEGLQDPAACHLPGEHPGL